MFKSRKGGLTASLLLLLSLFTFALPSYSDIIREKGPGGELENPTVELIKPIPPVQNFLFERGIFGLENRHNQLDVISIPRVEVKRYSYYTPQFERSFEEFGIETTNSFEESDLFTEYGLDYNSTFYSADSIDFFLSQANSLLSKIEEENRFVEYLTEGVVFELPVGIRKEIGGMQYSLVIHQMKLSPNKAYLDAYILIEIPQLEQKLAFMGKGIAFTNKGGITGVGTVELIGNFNIPFAGNKVMLTLLGGNLENLSGSSPTYATFDCYGFKEMGIKADVEFSRDLLKKENADGQLAEENLKVNFETVIEDWNNFIVGVSIPKFQLSRLEGVSFAVRDAVFDFSDIRNPSGMNFPEGYQSNLPESLSINHWRGFYLREVNITLPTQFNKNGSDQPTSINAYDLIIDNTGITGAFNAQNLISLNEGTSSDWAMSLDSIGFSMIQNNLQSAGFKGEIIVPVLDEREPLAYKGLIFNNSRYELSVTLQDSISMNLWAAKAQFEENSRITLRVEDGKFKPEAYLNGSMNVQAPVAEGSSSRASLANIRFQGLVIRTEAPYMEADAFSFGAEGVQQRLSGFPITISDIGFKTEGERTGINFDVTVNFVGANDAGFGGSSTLVIWGEKSNADKWSTWRYESIEVQRILLEVDKGPAFKLKGQVVFFKEDATYGTGFRGDIDLTVAEAFTLEATALFGTVNNYRYWYADAMATFKPTIPFVTGLDLAGFGGGIYYHMRQQNYGEHIAGNLGRSRSGIVYVPDKDILLGLKASLKVATSGSETVFNADATFEINFNSSGGINQISLQGNAYFVTPTFDVDPELIKKAASNIAGGGAVADIDVNSSFYGSMRILYDHPSKTFHGNIDVHANIIGLARGRGANDRAGWVEMHFEPGSWYVHVGSPTDPLGMTLYGLADIGAYFMVGDNMPPPPSPPDLIKDILNIHEMNNQRNTALLGSGRGLAFGASFSIDTGDQRFLIFYGRFAATAGFDFMMTNYGTANCIGSSGPLGMNGWYASGQAYVGMMATVGMQVNLKFIKKEVEIFSGAAAVLMQAEAPNPTWLKGTVAGRYNVLNGLVKGSFKFEVEVGERCEMENIIEDNPLADMEIIAQLTPNNGAQEVDVFTSPQVVFNIPVDKVFELVDFDGKTNQYKVELDYVKLKAGNVDVPGNLSFNAENDVIAYKLVNVLSSETEHTFEVQVSFKERKQGGVWKEVKVDGAVLKESKSIRFTAGIEPDYIPKHNISYSYPIDKQVNFYKDEYDKGYIQLDLGQSKPFENPGNIWGFVARFENESGSKFESGFTYSSSRKEIGFNIPANLPKGEVLRMDLLRVPRATTVASIDRNVQNKETKVEDARLDVDIDLEVRTREAEGSIETLQEQSMLTYYLRTSEYGTLEDKLTGNDVTSTGVRAPIGNRIGIHYLTYILNSKDVIDEFEFNGGPNFEPLIQFEVDFTNLKWYNNYLYPIIYEGYPLHSNARITYREEAEIGVPPIKAVYFLQRQYQNLRIENEGFDQSLPSSKQRYEVYYHVAHYADLDLKELKTKVINHKINSGASYTSRELLLINRDFFPVKLKETYPVKVKYLLPGKSNPVSEFTLNIINPLGKTE